MQRNMERKQKYYNIEFLRFAFAICIVYFHLLHSFMMDYTGGCDLYLRLAEQSKYAKYIVECFFIISGLFSLSYNKETSGYDNAEFCYKKSDPLMACTGMFHYYFGSIFWKIHLCIFCRPFVSSVQWTCN